jgi:phospholipase/carboxylesterase
MLVRKGKAGGIGIVFLHGYGASAADLFPLAAELATSDEASWYFPDAPLAVPLGPHMSGRAWFPIPARELQHGVDYSNTTPPGLEKSAIQLLTLLKTLPHEQFILGGFSQGAMLSTQVVLSAPERFKSLVILSGTIVHGGVWKKLALKAGAKSFFQSHGTSDPVLPFGGAEKLHQLLLEAGWEGDLKSFRGGHDIPTPILRDLKSFLKNQISVNQ